MPGEVDRRSGLGAREEQVLAEIDQELKAALSVTLSADFEARVLQRVEADETPRRSHYAWLAAAAALVLAAGLFYTLNRTPAIDPVPPQMADRRPDVVLPTATAPPSPVSGTSTSRVPAPPSARTFARRAEPEVIVPLNQMEAVRRLVRAVNEGRLDPPPEPLQGPVAPPAELAVTPLVVEPIPVPELGPDVQPPSPDIRRSY